MFYNARYYSPLLSRFVSADTIVPNGEKASIIPLTVDFHEPMFLAGVAEENAFTLNYGFWSQLSGKQKEKAKLPWGPQNPQALNRYAYVLNNPLKYNDTTGHCASGAGVDTVLCGLTAISSPAWLGPVLIVGGIVVVAVVAYVGISWLSEQLIYSPHQKDWIPPGMSAEERKRWGAAAEIYKGQVDNLPPGFQLPKDLALKLRELIKKGLSPEQAADAMPELEDYIGEGQSDDSGDE